MHRPLALSLLAFSLACTAAPDVPDAGETPSNNDAGPTDAGFDPTYLPADPTLAQLADWWDANLRCRAFACEQRVRENAATCAQALAAHGIPYDTFRKALASVQAGRATYDTTAGRRCAGFLNTVPRTGDCFGDDVVPFRDAYGPQFLTFCADLLTGSVEHGGACDDDLECVAGAGCVFDRGDECAGQCVVWLKVGDACSEHPADCAPTAYCDGTVCKSRNLKPDGAQCFDSGESCQSGQCFDYQCRTTSPFEGECIEEDDCAANLYCRPLPPSTGRLGICQYPVLSGAECGYTIQCAGSQPCAGFFQKYLGGWTPGTCGDDPEDVGGDCVPIAEGYDFGQTGCFEDLYCNPATSKCEEAPAIGAACMTPGNRCGFRAYCDAEGTCRAQKGPGEAAEHQRECLDSFDSFNKVCFRQAERARCGRF